MCADCCRGVSRTGADVLAGDAQVEVMGISVDSVQTTRDYVEERGLEFPVVNFPATPPIVRHRLPSSAIVCHRPAFS